MLSIHNASRFSQAQFSVLSTFMHWMSYWKISTNILILLDITSSLNSFVWTWSLITILDTAASFNTKSSHSSKNIWPCPSLTSWNFTKRDEIDSVFEALQCMISMTSSHQNSILFLESKIVVLIMKRGSEEGMQVIPMLDLNHSFASNSIFLCTIFWNPRSSSLIMKHGSQEGRCASHSNACFESLLCIGLHSLAIF
jgi:hypothetical protein